MTDLLEPNWPEAGVLVVAHGARDAPQSIADTSAHVDRIAASGAFAQVEAGFLTGGRPPGDALSAMQTSKVYVVPHFMGEGYFVRQALPEALGLGGAITRLAGHQICLCRPPSAHPDFPDIIAEICMKEAQVSGFPAETPELVLVAHGSADNAASADHVRWVQSNIAGFRRVWTAFLEQPPDLETVLDPIDRPAVVAGLFAANGAHADRDVTSALARHTDRVSASNADCRFAYTGAIGAAATLTPLFTAQIAAFDLQHGAACDRSTK